jgi:hypothetical protein
MIGLTAPRGIVAAAVASLGARAMSEAGIAGGPAMEGLVYLAILVTGTWSTVAALVLPRVLGFTRDPTRRRAVLVGANALNGVLARHLTAAGRTTIVVDAVSWRLDRFRKAGLLTVVGDARDASAYEEAGVERDSTVVAATTNDELNLLSAELVRAEFGVEHPVVAIQRPPDELGRRSRAWVDLLGGGAIDVPKWVRRIENDQFTEMTIDPRPAEAVADLHAAERERPNGVLRLLGYQGDEPVLQVGDDRFNQLDRLTLLVTEGRPLELLAPHRLPLEAEPTAVPQAAEVTPDLSTEGEGSGP